MKLNEVLRRYTTWPCFLSRSSIAELLAVIEQAPDTPHDVVREAAARITNADQPQVVLRELVAAIDPADVPRAAAASAGDTEPVYAGDAPGGDLGGSRRVYGAALILAEVRRSASQKSVPGLAEAVSKVTRRLRAAEAEAGMPERGKRALAEAREAMLSATRTMGTEVSAEEQALLSRIPREDRRKALHFSREFDALDGRVSMSRERYVSLNMGDA